MTIVRYFRDVAPFWDKYDWAFAVVLAGIVALGYVAHVELIPSSGLLGAGADFIRNSGVIALLTAWTAIIALYRLRHRPEKTRPAVREDFFNCASENSSDFGLRNFGPGPALYIQAVATVETDQKQEEVLRLKVHDQPIHLREGEFVSLVQDVEHDWVSKMAKKFETNQPEGNFKRNQGNEPLVNLYFSYVSRSGAREPTTISSNRDDADLLDKINNPDEEPRKIELSRLTDMG